jgi:hypothetical protein
MEVFVVRRIQDLSERIGNNLTVILLDWEKAFDKLD